MRSFLGSESVILLAEPGAFVGGEPHLAQFDPEVLRVDV